MIIQFNDDSDEIVVYDDKKDAILRVCRNEFTYTNVKELIKKLIDMAVGFDRLNQTIVNIQVTKIDEGRETIIDEY